MQLCPELAGNPTGRTHPHASVSFAAPVYGRLDVALANTNHRLPHASATLTEINSTNSTNQNLTASLPIL